MMSARGCVTVRCARIVDAGGETIGDAQPLLDLAQHQDAAVRRQQTTIECRNDGFAGDR